MAYERRLGRRRRRPEHAGMDGMGNNIKYDIILYPSGG